MQRGSFWKQHQKHALSVDFGQAISMGMVVITSGQVRDVLIAILIGAMCVHNLRGLQIRHVNGMVQRLAEMRTLSTIWCKHHTLMMIDVVVPFVMCADLAVLANSVQGIVWFAGVLWHLAQRNAVLCRESKSHLGFENHLGVPCTEHDTHSVQNGFRSVCLP